MRRALGIGLLDLVLRFDKQCKAVFELVNRLIAFIELGNIPNKVNLKLVLENGIVSRNLH